MANAAKKKPLAKRYDPPLAVDGSSLDIIQASVKDSSGKTVKKAAAKQQGDQGVYVPVTDQGGLTAAKKKESE